jgi:hypothetical protein
LITKTENLILTVLVNTILKELPDSLVGFSNQDTAVFKFGRIQDHNSSELGVQISVQFNIRIPSAIISAVSVCLTKRGFTFEVLEDLKEHSSPRVLNAETEVVDI